MTVLVTGGAGFIRSHISLTLLEEGYDVVVIDPLDPYYDTRIKDHNLELCRETGGDRFTHVDGSITDQDLVDSVSSVTGSASFIIRLHGRV